MCGAALSADDKFCTDCGRPVSVIVRACDACGSSLRGSSRFCVKCGAPATRPAGHPAHPKAPRDRAWWRSRVGAGPVYIVSAGCLLCIAIYVSLSVEREAARAPSGTATTASGTLGTFRPNTGDFSVKQAFTALYGNYDPNLDGAFWKATAVPKALAEWNGRTLFIRPLISRGFVDAGNTRHLLVTNSLDVRNGDVVKQGTGCRTCGSLIGAAIFERRPEGWKLISRHDFLTADGKWGAPPKVSVAFSGSAGIELQFEARRADSRDGARAPYTIVLKERVAPVVRASANEDAPR
jgi:hypothetical protein